MAEATGPYAAAALASAAWQLREAGALWLERCLLPDARARPLPRSLRCELRSHCSHCCLERAGARAVQWHGIPPLCSHTCCTPWVIARRDGGPSGGVPRARSRGGGSGHCRRGLWRDSSTAGPACVRDGPRGRRLRRGVARGAQALPEERRRALARAAARVLPRLARDRVANVYGAALALLRALLAARPAAAPVGELVPVLLERVRARLEKNKKFKKNCGTLAGRWEGSGCAHRRACARAVGAGAKWGLQKQGRLPAGGEGSGCAHRRAAPVLLERARRRPDGGPMT